MKLACHLRAAAVVASACLPCWCAIASLLAAEPATALVRSEPWTTVFAEEEVTIHWKIEGRKIKGRLLWTLSSSEGLTLLRGELPAEREELELAVKFPPVKPGVVLATVLTARLYPDGAREPVAEYRAPIFVYPADPFFDRQEILKQLPVHLFDPAGVTATTLTEAKFPFKPVQQVAAIDELTDGVLLIGEGTSFRDERSLADALFQAAARGLPVLCLAPQDGELEIPRPSDKFASFVGMSFESEVMVRQLDKRLDDRYWMKTAVASHVTLLPVGRGPRIVVEVQANAGGWQWLELQFAGKKANDFPRSPGSTKLIVTSLPVIEHWKSGPTPRYLFSHLVNRVAHVPLETAEKAIETP